jgi:y4mF family transcriptional regulator
MTDQSSLLSQRPLQDEQPVAIYIRARRKANRLSQRALAEIAGVSQRFISELERGKQTARMDAVNAVLAVFGKRLGVTDAPRPNREEAQ